MSCCIRTCNWRRQVMPSYSSSITPVPSDRASGRARLPTSSVGHHWELLAYYSSKLDPQKGYLLYRIGLHDQPQPTTPSQAPRVDTYSGSMLLCSRPVCSRRVCSWLSVRVAISVRGYQCAWVSLTISERHGCRNCSNMVVQVGMPLHSALLAHSNM